MLLIKRELELRKILFAYIAEKNIMKAAALQFLIYSLLNTSHLTVNGAVRLMLITPAALIARFHTSRDVFIRAEYLYQIIKGFLPQIHGQQTASLRSSGVFDKSRSRQFTQNLIGELLRHGFLLANLIGWYFVASRQRAKNSKRIIDFSRNKQCHFLLLEFG